MSKTWRTVLVFAFVGWSVFAYQWTEVGCSIPRAYLAVVEYGTPEGIEFLPACHG